VTIFGAFVKEFVCFVIIGKLASVGGFWWFFAIKCSFGVFVCLIWVGSYSVWSKATLVDMGAVA